MGEQSTLMEIALKSVESSDFGGTFELSTRDGKLSGPCCLGAIGVGSRFVAGGFSPNAEVTITVRKSVLQTTPKTGQGMAVTDKTGAVRSLKVANEGVKDCLFAWEITADDSNQNA